MSNFWFHKIQSPFAMSNRRSVLNFNDIISYCGIIGFPIAVLLVLDIQFELDTRPRGALQTLFCYTSLFFILLR